MSTRIVYMGTPDFAVPALRMLATMEDVTIPLVVSQPDRVAGRGKKVQRTPVAACADHFNIPTYQPETLRSADAVAHLKRCNAELFVVAAYGQILSQELLDVPTMGCINLHASLLPRWRGAAPIQWAVAKGDAVTGVSLMKMEAGLDTGPVYAQSTLMIQETETASELHDRLAEQAADLLQGNMNIILDPRHAPTPQNADRHTYARTLSANDRRLDFELSAQALAWYINGMSSWPGARCVMGGTTMKILRARVSSHPVPLDIAAGTILLANHENGLHIAAGDGKAVEILEIQRPGKNSMSAKQLLQGYEIAEGILVETYVP